MSLTPEQRKELRQTLTTFDDHDRIDRGLAVALDDIDRLEAENKKLRDALEHADCEWCKSFGDLYPQIPECPDCKAARAALRREPE